MLTSEKKYRLPLIIGIIAAVAAVIVATLVAISANSPSRRLADTIALGKQYLSELNYEQAVAAFTEALAIEPKDGAALSGLAEAYLAWADAAADGGDLERAQEILENGIAALEEYASENVEAENWLERLEDSQESYREEPLSETTGQSGEAESGEEESPVVRAVDPGELPESLTTFLLYFNLYYDEDGGMKFDSAPDAIGKYDMIDHLVGLMHCVQENLYPHYFREESWDGATQPYDPLGWWTEELQNGMGSGMVSGEYVEWVAENVFHYSEEAYANHLRTWKNDYAYYYDGFFYYMFGGVGALDPAIWIDSAWTDGEKYYIRYQEDWTEYWAEIDEHIAVVQWREVDGFGFWSLISHDVEWEMDVPEAAKEEAEDPGMIQHVDYYDDAGTLLYYEDDAYYSNGLLCSRTLYRMEYGYSTPYPVLAYTILYLYDEQGSPAGEMIRAGYPNYYDAQSGRVILKREYSSEPPYSAYDQYIYPALEDVNLRKFGVNPAKTEVTYGDAVLFPEGAEQWVAGYRKSIFEDHAGDYAEFESNGYSYMDVRFVDIDGNQIPEVWMDTNTGYGGAQFYTYENGMTDMVYIDHGWAEWIPSEKLLHTESGHSDEYTDGVYRVGNGRFNVVATGNYGAEDNASLQWDENGALIYRYYWNGINVSSWDEYRSELGKVFDFSKATSEAGPVYSFEQAARMLEVVERLGK